MHQIFNRIWNKGEPNIPPHKGFFSFWVITTSQKIYIYFQQNLADRKKNEFINQSQQNLQRIFQPELGF